MIFICIRHLEKKVRVLLRTLSLPSLPSLLLSAEIPYFFFSFFFYFLCHNRKNFTPLYFNSGLFLNNYELVLRLVVFRERDSVQIQFTLLGHSLYQQGPFKPALHLSLSSSLSLFFFLLTAFLLPV